MTTLTKKKYREFTQSLADALEFYNEDGFRHALWEFRMAAEAFMKIFILKEWGDDLGHDIIIGHLDTDGNNTDRAKELQYGEMLAICTTHSLVKADVKDWLIAIQKSNSAAHNPNSPINYAALATQCHTFSKKLYKYVVQQFHLIESEEITKAFDGQLDGSKGIEEDPWMELCSVTDNFSRSNRYVLVSPPSFNGGTTKQIQLLSRIDWSFVLDFDPGSKETGLFSSFRHQETRNIVPLTIKQKGQRNYIGNGGPGNTNWLFSNGINSLPDTLVRNFASWRTKKYHQFISEVLKDFFSREVHPYVFIYLWDDEDYIGELIKIWDNINLPSDLVKHVFLTTNISKADKFSDYARLGYDVTICALSPLTFIGQLEKLLNESIGEDKRYLVPGRTSFQENETIDVSDIYHRLADNGLTVVYQSVYTEISGNNESNVPAFLKGEAIQWSELEVGLDAQRHRYSDLHYSIKSLLSGTKQSIKFEIHHKPGAGGTIIGHRLAFDLRGEYPTMMIKRYDSRTFQSLSLFLEKVNKTVLAIVEASNVDEGGLSELIRACNSLKRTVVFVYIKRSLQIEKTRNLTFFLNDNMADKLEMNRFLQLVRLYADKDQVSLMSNNGIQPSELEVIDFSLAINEKTYNSERLNDYISAYINKMPESHVSFSVYSSFIYYYSQKSVSHLVLRSLFKKSLTEELRHLSVKKHYIRKLLVELYNPDENGPGEYWRPRFAKFAEIILSLVIGNGKQDNWKDHLMAYAKQFIHDFKLNNEYLVDETRDIIKGVFFGRDNDGLDNSDQTGTAVVEDRFSKLLRDVGEKNQQKEILKTLVDAYPNEGHFQGQLGRFLYEKAEELEEFRESEDLISNAIDSSEGRADFNLHHIAGMCKSREIKFMLKRFRASGIPDVTETRLKNLVDEGCSYFEESIKINPYNIHAYVAQIHILMDAIDFGRELGGTEGRWAFLSADNNRWYMDKFNDIMYLIEKGKSLIESEKTLALSSRIIKAGKYVKSGEIKALDLIGDFKTSAEGYTKLIDSVERAYRPQIRVMAVYSTLMGKVNGNRREIDQAWQRLKTEEAQLIQKMLKDNILQDPKNILSFKLWFKLVRFSNLDVSMDDIISTMKLWYENSESSNILRSEAAFYLYIMYAIEVITAGDAFSINARNQCQIYLASCREHAFNRKFNFEYLGYGQGLDALINHREARDADEDLFQRTIGTISLIKERQEGTIQLKCGLEAFFVPKVGNFVSGKDETALVTFKLGFRHEGLVAIDVRRVKDLLVIDDQSLSEDDVSEVFEPVEPIEPELLIESEQLPDENLIHTRYTIAPPKIIGKIDLDNIKDNRKKKK